ncbi:sigma-70 family RNA polymerase sigma factor [Flavivirga amylovorans]|uniref:Sigma-70 family RNA polymerase sigma factor n=1 Tax=Flavivirga amylovorans TaxID=870486 RepID=A0ABT8WWR0_9FLAO|nr:sigma-70 family RNA polymerase sigma factor [Flavivirga amylovorans]MDO5985824.1 sigma-70 family RNA polymerase sigma factor [Flavivirga amylovorans]
MNNNINSRSEELFRRYYSEWCLQAYCYLQNTVEAEEIVQDIFVQLLVTHKIDKITNLEAYMFKAIKNNSLKYLNRQEKFRVLKDIDAVSIRSIEEELVFLEKRKQLQKMLELLPNQCKTIFELCVIEEQKYQNVSEIMGISINTIKYHMKNAYKILRHQKEVLHVAFFMIFTAI